FQAEDGIRDSSVTGVQTCALPISLHLITGRQHFTMNILFLCAHTHTHTHTCTYTHTHTHTHTDTHTHTHTHTHRQTHTRSHAPLENLSQLHSVSHAMFIALGFLFLLLCRCP